MRFLTSFGNLLWTWILPVMLVGTAILCGVSLKFTPISHPQRILHNTYGTLFRRPCDKKQLRTTATALAATMGTGNLVGTAAAICTGGAGAVFWMLCSAVLGILLVYAENTIGMRFRRRLPNGTWCGGAIACLRYGLKKPALSYVFAVCCATAGLGMGSMAQASAIVSTAENFGIPRNLVGLTVCLTAAWILYGGKNRIGSVTVWLMPLICGLYLLGCGVLICKNAAYLSDAIARIFREAFGFRGMVGGFCGTAFLRSMSVGLRRGIFSNEAGLGTSAMLHMEADASVSSIQGDWAAVEVFADTVICCTATALVILTTPQLSCSIETDASALLLNSFSYGFGSSAAGFLAVSMILLAFATLIGWYPCGLAAVRSLGICGAEDVYFVLWILAAFCGTLNPAAFAFALCDCCNALMAIPNLYALTALRKNLKMEEVHENSKCGGT